MSKIICNITINLEVGLQDPAGMSAHERRMTRMRERVAKLEASALAERDWFLRGEANAGKSERCPPFIMNLSFFACQHQPDGNQVPALLQFDAWPSSVWHFVAWNVHEGGPACFDPAAWLVTQLALEVPACTLGHSVVLEHAPCQYFGKTYKPHGAVCHSSRGLQITEQPQDMQ